LANGLVQTRTWRGDNLPKTIVAGSVTNLTYGWDANKRKTVETNGVDPARTNNYNGYDDEDRLRYLLAKSGITDREKLKETPANRRIGSD